MSQFNFTMVAPSININGDTAESLLKEHIEANHAVQLAIEALRKIAPHGRNYQTQPEESFKFAREAYFERLGILNELASDLMGVAINIDHQKRN